MNVTVIREAYGLSRADLAKAFSCAPFTVTRWEIGYEPTGIHRAVLKAMEAAASQTDKQTLLVGGALLVTLGVGGVYARGIERMVPLQLPKTQVGKESGIMNEPEQGHVSRTHSVVSCVLQPVWTATCRADQQGTPDGALGLTFVTASLEITEHGRFAYAAVRMTPEEARTYAGQLVVAADEAEEQGRRAAEAQDEGRAKQ